MFSLGTPRLVEPEIDGGIDARESFRIHGIIRRGEEVVVMDDTEAGAPLSLN